MEHNDTLEPQDLPAGCFSAWLRRTRSALVHDSGADVPCADCIACCSSSYFIHIRPEETQTLSIINRKLLFAAPGLPKGNVLLGYDENGHCPMLIDNKCSIYENRPLTCRIYDCRIFAAAGIAAGEGDKGPINQRIRQWKFSYPTERDSEQHSAVQAAAKFLGEHAACFPGEVAPNNSSQIAILAIKVYNVFLKYKEESEQKRIESSDSKLIKAIMRANQKFEVRSIKLGS